MIAEEDSSGKTSSARQTPVNYSELDARQIQSQEERNDEACESRPEMNMHDVKYAPVGILGDLMASLREIGHFEENLTGKTDKENCSERLLGNTQGFLQEMLPNEDTGPPLSVSSNHDHSSDNRNILHEKLSLEALPMHYKFQAPFLFQGNELSVDPVPSQITAGSRCQSCGHWMPRDNIFCGVCGHKHDSPVHKSPDCELMGDSPSETVIILPKYDDSKAKESTRVSRSLLCTQ